MYSGRLKSLCFVHFPKWGEIALNLVKKVIKPKLYERVSLGFLAKLKKNIFFYKIKFYDDFESLKEVFPEEVLPVDFGGVGYTLEQLGGNLLLYYNLVMI